MISGYIAQKGPMTSIFDKDAKRVGVTTLKALPLTVTKILGDNRVQVAYGKKHHKEFTITTDIAPKVGDIITPDLVFTEGESVMVSGTSKGRGFAGVIKRHGFKKQPIKNASDRIRAPGAVGAQTPSKIVKGKKMPGHYGNKTKTIEGLSIFSLSKEKNEIIISGSIPGAPNSWVLMRKR